MGLKDKLGSFKGMSRQKKIMVGVIALLVLFLVSRIISALSGGEEAAIQKKYIPVNAQTVTKESISTNIILSGKVYADKEAAVLAKTPGRVVSIAVKVGDVVQKDQVLFSLDKSDMQASYNQAVAGLKMAEANYQMNKEKLDNAKIQLGRYQQLYEAGAISKVELEQAELQASDASIMTVEAQRDQARAQYDAAAKSYSDLDVKSPIAGIVTSLSVRVGDMATNAAPVAMVVDMDNVYVEVSVSEKVINSIDSSREVQVEIASAFSGAVKGKIDGLSLAADARTGKYMLKINIPNEEHQVKAGMFAKVVLNTATKDDVVVVTADAVVYRSGRNVVYVIEDNDGTVVEREVATGLENGKQVEIVSGLEEGDILIVKGMSFIKEDSEIKIIELDGVPVVQEDEIDDEADGSTEGDEAEGGAKQ